MSKQVYINLPVSDLAASTTFYTALGFTKNDTYSNDKASSMMWSEDIVVMLLAHDFYQSFLQGKTIADTKATSSVLLSLLLDSKEAVQTFADTAKANGGSYYQISSGISEDMMFGYEVSDPDGNTWEPIWMNDSFDPQAQQPS